MTRRQFLFGSTTAALRATYGYPAYDRIRVGCIGVGGRARVLMRNFEIVKGLEIAAVCDICVGETLCARLVSARRCKSSSLGSQFLLNTHYLDRLQTDGVFTANLRLPPAVPTEVSSDA